MDFKWNGEFSPPVSKSKTVHPDLAGNYMFRVNTRNTRKSSEIFSKLTINTPQLLAWFL